MLIFSAILSRFNLDNIVLFAIFLVFVTLRIMMELTAKPRIVLGKKVKNLRKEGLLPCVVYGETVVARTVTDAKNKENKTEKGHKDNKSERMDQGGEALPVSVSYKDFEKIFKEAGETTLIHLKIAGDALRHEKEYNVLINDVAFDPIKGNPIHADFYAVRMDKAIKTKVPIELFGESPAVKNFSGILVKVMQELEVEALPKDLPRELRADLSLLAELEGRLFVRDIAVPAGVKILAEEDGVVALIEPPRTEEEVEELKKAEAPEGVAEVKTEKEVKAEEKAKDKTTEEETQ